MMISIKLCWDVPPTDGMDENRYDYVLNYLTNSVNNAELTYNQSFDIVVEVLSKIFTISRGQAYIKLSQSFPRDSLQRSLPTYDGLQKRAKKLPVRYKEAIDEFDLTPDLTTEHFVVISNLEEKEPIFTIFISEPDQLSSYFSHTLTWHKKYAISDIHRDEEKRNEFANKQLKLFYETNIKVIEELRKLSYLAQKKVTRIVLARLMSPFWLHTNKATTLDEQDSLISESLKAKNKISRDLDKWKFKQQVPLPRKEEYNIVRLIKVTLPKQTVYALLIKHHIEGINIVTLKNKVKIAKSGCYNSPTPDPIESHSLDEWVQNLAYGNEKIAIKFHYRQPLEHEKVPTCSIEVIYETVSKLKTSIENGKKIHTQFKYTYQNTTEIPNEFSSNVDYSSEFWMAKPATKLTSNEIVSHPFRTNDNIPFDRNNTIELELGCLGITTRLEVEQLLNEWAKSLDTTPRKGYQAPNIEPYKKDRKKEANNRNSDKTMKKKNGKHKTDSEIEKIEKSNKGLISLSQNLLKGKKLGDNF